MEKREVISNASQAIKPTLWYTNSILDCAEFVTDSEIKQLKELTIKTEQLKKDACNIDREISEILDNASKKCEDSKKEVSGNSSHD